MKKLIVFSILLLSLVIVTMAQASVFDISVTEAGDRVYNRNWGYWGTWTGWVVGANPNEVSHTYSPGYGDSNSTYLTFDISSFDVPSTEIVSVSLYINILSVTLQ